MNCPRCKNAALVEVVRENVQIDICPECKGIWLDRGELEKIIQGYQNEQKDSDWDNGDEKKGRKKEKSGNAFLNVLGDIVLFW